MTFLLAAGGAALGFAGVGGLTLASGAALGLGLGSALGTSRAASGAAQTQADASRQAADVQAQSNREALALQRQMYDEQKALQEPYRQAGLTAQNRLMTLLGLQGDPQAQKRLAADQAGNVPIGGFLGSMTPNQLLRGGKAPSQLVGATPSAAYVGGDVNAADFGLANRPFSMAGFDPNSLMKNFTAADYQADPGYAFRLSEGLKTLQSNARARGGAVSGATMKGAINYAGDAASQEYQNAFNRFQAGRAVQGQEYGNAFNRFQTNRTNMLQPLGSLLASGQNAASNQGAAAGSYGSSGANLLTGAGQAMAGGITGAGQAMAAGQLGSANTLANTLGSTASAYQDQQNFNRYLASRQPSSSMPANTYTSPYAPAAADPYSGVYQSNYT